MADGGRIRVTVLEGCFAGLQGVGIPLPVCIHLQDLELQFEGAQWTAKQSNTEFSIFFFWPVHGRSTWIYLARSAKSVGRGPDAHLDGPVAVWEGGKEAAPGPSNMDDKNETPL